MVDEPPIDLGIAGLGPAVRIGRGGFADVFRAQQTSLRREVAVKVLRAPAGDDTARLRFERECHAMGPLSTHPNIVSVHEGGFTPDGRAYLVMEYFTGGSLQDRLHRSGPLPADDVVDVGAKIGRALGVAHDAGVLHRDVKPANILVSAYGEPALGDFGIARIEGGHQTASGQVTASFAHAAPEALESEPVSPASDLYSLGSTLFELFVGHPPHVRPDDHSLWAVMNRVLTQPVPDPVSVGMPQPRAAVVARATARRPEDRYQRAADLVAELTGSPARSRPVTVPAPAVAVPRSGPADETLMTGSQLRSGDEDGNRSGIGHAAPDRPFVATRVQEVHSRSGATTDRPGLTVGGPAPARRSHRSTRRWPVAVALLLLAVVAGVVGWYLASDVGADADPGDGNEALAAGAYDAGSDSTPGPTEPVRPEIGLALAAAQEGPLDQDETYDLVVIGLDESTDARYRLVVDGEAEGEPTADLASYRAEPGRHSLAVEITQGDQVETTGPVELYVLGDPPEVGSVRVNLASNSADPGRWRATLRQFDELVDDGHEELQIYPNDDPEDPRWHLFVPDFDSRVAGRQYCRDFGLDDVNLCYPSVYDPTPTS